MLYEVITNDFAILTFDRPVEAAMQANEIAAWQGRGATFVWLRPA